MRFSLPQQFKASDVASTGEFSGYAAIFGNVDLGGDVVLPGAFNGTLKTHRDRKSTPALLWSHDASVIVGRITELAEDRKGLFMSGKLSLDTRAGAEAYALLKDDAIGGMSIGYSPGTGGVEYSAEARLLKQVELYEVSLVAVPMNPEARITAVKAMDCADRRELEHALRETLSLSSRKAKAAASALWPILSDRDGREDDREDQEAYNLQLKALADKLTSINKLL